MCKPLHSNAKGSHPLLKMDGWGGSEAAMEQASPYHCYGLPPRLEMNGWGGIEAFSNKNPIPKVWASMQGQSLFESCVEGNS